VVVSTENWGKKGREGRGPDRGQSLWGSHYSISRSMGRENESSN